MIKGSYTNLIGRRFGRLVVVDLDREKGYKRYWLCRCDCGGEKAIGSEKLIAGWTKSCGCIAREKASQRLSTHKMSKSITYKSWSGMVNRATNKNDTYHQKYYKNVKICERWLTFENFLEDMGERPAKEYSIDRVDVMGDYCPENCKWSTMKEQMRNTTNNIMVKHNGNVVRLISLKDISSVPYPALTQRISKGWSIEKALSTPTMKNQFC